jgi:Zn-dependent protease with chaperone function
MVFLTLVCLCDWYPELPWIHSPQIALLLTAGAVSLVAGHAYWISRRVTWPLARDPAVREVLLTRYDHWRFVHQSAQVGIYVFALALLGWGWGIRQVWKWNTGQPEPQPLPGLELLTLLPFLAGQVLTWVFFYDADRALHRASHRTLETDPFAQNWSEVGGSSALPQRGAPSETAPSFGLRWTYVLFQLRQKLALVFIPVLLLIAQKELYRLSPPTWQHWQTTINGAGFVVLVGVFLCMPWLIRLALGLKPLPRGVLRDRLEAAAQRLGFRCSDILLWNTRSGMANAMVIGLVPWLRYVVFTDRLIEEFPEEEVEAVFGHEVGHIRYHHMLFYLTFLILSMAVVFTAGHIAKDHLLGLGRALADHWPGLLSVLPAEGIVVPVEAKETMEILSVITLMVGYIFLVFGFLSRRCERQADVFGCRAVSCSDPNCLEHAEPTVLVEGGKGLCPTGIRTFVRALEKVAHVNGISRERPGFLQSWQHSTIARRVAFLRSVLVDSRVEAAFQRRLALGKWGLLVGLATALALLAVLGKLRGWGW